MSLFNNLTTDGIEKSEDRLGGFSLLETDIYIATIKALYAGEAESGAMSVSLIADINGQEYKETFYVTSGKAKGRRNYYERDGKKMPLPGFTTVDDICLIATGEPLASQQTEDKVINIYNFEEKREVPTTVPMLVDAIGQQVALGIRKVLENKSEKKGDEYVAIADTREINEVEKVFHPEMKLTVNEAKEGKEEAKFWDAWVERNKGKIRDKRTIKDGEGGSVGRPSKGAPTSGSAPAPTKSLFGKK